MNRYLILCWLWAGSLSACPVCEKQQPKGFAGITHGTGPENVIDYWILYGALTLVGLTFGLYVWYIFQPETTATRHLKRQFLTDWNHE
jgi:hypothetical protein